MPAPAKPKKTVRNRPDVFDEMITLALPHTPVSRPRVAMLSRANRLNLKLILAIIWFAAVITAGIGIGRLISLNRQTVSFEPAIPVAKAGVTVSALDTPDILFAQVRTVDSLSVMDAAAPIQAQSGSTLQTMSLGAIQGTAGSNGLQPGFTHSGRIQGNLGTAPSR